MGQICGLNFPLPEQDSKGKGDRRVELQRFREILDDLPYGDQEQAAHELFNILFKLNRIVFTADERLALIRQIEEPAFHIFDGLQQKIKDISAPIGRKDEHIAKTLVGVNFEFALAYRCLLIKPPVKGMLRSVDHDAVADYIRLSLYHMGEVLRTKYHARNNPGGTIWRYIYALFACGYKLDIHHITLPVLPWCRFETVEETFKSILLLAMSSPLTMRGTYFNSLYRLVPKLAPYIELGKIRCGENYTGLSTFDLSGTEPPKKQIMSGCDACGNASNCFSLNTEPLLNYIQQQVELGGSNGQHTDLQKFLSEPYQLDGLMRNLGGGGRLDSSERIAGADYSVEIVVGINGAHEVLSLHTAESNHGEEDITLTDTEKWTSTGIHGAAQRRTNCVVINRSSGGYCLYVDANKKFFLQVGEPAIVREANGGCWRPAVISWVSGNRSRMDFGVKFLGDNAYPGMLRPIYNDSIDGVVNCLLLVDEYSAELPARIITTPSNLAKGDALLVKHEDGEYEVSVSHIQTKTSGYVEYRCGWEDRQQAAAVKEQAGFGWSEPNETDFDLVTDFDSLWNKL